MVVWCCYVVWFWLVLSTSLKYTSLALGQSHDCPSACEAILKNIGINEMTWTYLNVKYDLKLNSKANPSTCFKRYIVPCWDQSCHPYLVITWIHLDIYIKKINKEKPVAYFMAYTVHCWDWSWRPYSIYVMAQVAISQSYRWNPIEYDGTPLIHGAYIWQVSTFWLTNWAHYKAYSVLRV